MFWKVRAIPFCTILYAGDPRIDSPSSSTAPASGLYRRVITLNAVVFPAPFGPIRPGDVPFLDVERDPVEGDDPSEAERDVPNREEGHRRPTLNGFDAW